MLLKSFVYAVMLIFSRSHVLRGNAFWTLCVLHLENNQKQIRKNRTRINENHGKIYSRKSFVYAVIFILLFIFSYVSAFAQQQQRKLCGKAYIIGIQEELNPIKNATLRIEETDDSDVTTSTGHFCIPLKDVFKAGDTVTVRVDSKDYQIYDPPAGKVRVPADLAKTKETVRLDKTGSHRFMTTQAFNLMMENIAGKAKAEVKADQPQRKPDLTPYLKEWAAQYGFTVDQVRTELDKWSKESTDDLYELGLKAFYEKNFQEAARNFNSSAEQNKSLMEKKRKETEELQEKVIRDYRLAGDSWYNDYRFDKCQVSIGCIQV